MAWMSWVHGSICQISALHQAKKLSPPGFTCLTINFSNFFSSQCHQGPWLAGKWPVSPPVRLSLGVRGLASFLEAFVSVGSMWLFLVPSKWLVTCDWTYITFYAWHEILFKDMNFNNCVVFHCLGVQWCLTRIPSCWTFYIVFNILAV